MKCIGLAWFARLQAREEELERRLSELRADLLSESLAGNWYSVGNILPVIERVDEEMKFLRGANT